MQLKVLQAAIDAIDGELARLDFDVMTGADAAAVVRVLSPCKHRIDAAVMAAASHAVEANQHNFDGSPSGAAWVAEVSGVSEKSARSQLMTQKHLRDLPDVAEDLRSGGISVDKAKAVAQGADGEIGLAAELLAVARSGSVEMVQQRARELRAALPDDGSRRQRMRESQYVNASVGVDSMIRGEFCLLPEVGRSLFVAATNARGATAWEQAEAWAALINQSGAKGPELVFHLDVQADESGRFSLGDRCELKSVGPVPMSSVVDVFENASKTLVGTVSNKLAYFSSEDRRSSTAPLPEWVKRSIRLKAYDRCEADGCTAPAADVDHSVARCNSGTNDYENLRALCRPHHDAKTKKDAPWTVGAIYAKTKSKRKSKAPPAFDGEMFPDTG